MTRSVGPISLLMGFLIFAVIRWLPGLDLLTIDEIESLTQAQQTLWTYSDNNHLLNTAWMMALGPHVGTIWIRALSLVSGVVSLWLIYQLPLPGQTPRERWIRSILAGFSFYLISFSSEARGYSTLIFFILAEWTLYLRIQSATKSKISFVLLFNLLASLGSATHPLHYVHFFALALAAVVSDFKAIRNLLRLFFVPTLVHGLLYLFFYRDCVILGSYTRGYLQVLERALSLCIGIHRPEWIVQWVSVIAIVLIVSGLRVIFKRSRFDGIYLGLMALLNIGIALNPLMSSRLAERYFSPLILIWLICASTLMAKMRMGNALAGMIVLFQLSLTYQLIETGRGNYLGAIEYIASQTRNPPITISFINDFRGRSLLSFYGGTQQFTYHEALSGGPEWFVLDRDWMMIDGSDILRFPGIQGRVQPPDRELTLTASQRTYQLVNEFTHFGISGSTWTIYRRKD